MLLAEITRQKYCWKHWRNGFVPTGTPKDLTFYFPCGTGDGINIRGMDHVAIVGLMKRIVAGSYVNPVNPATGKRPELMRLIRENAIEAYAWPIGASMHWLREVARRSPGYMTEIGLDTYIDPRQTGGKFTARAEDDLVHLIEFQGKPYLFYPTWKLDVAIIRAGEAESRQSVVRRRGAGVLLARARISREGLGGTCHRAGPAPGRAQHA